MKIPPVIKTYCPYCKKHTEHKVKEQHKGKGRKLAEGKRRFDRRVIKGYGAFCRPKQNISKRYGVKVSKKITLVLTCKECGKAIVKSVRRAKKWEIKRV